MIPQFLFGIGALVAAAPGPARTIDQSTMPGMSMPARAPAARTKAPHPKAPVAKAPARGTPAPRPHSPAGKPPAAMVMPNMRMGGTAAAPPPASHDMPGVAMPPGEDLPHAMSSESEPATPRAGTDLDPRDAPAPAPSSALAASRYYGAAAMNAANRDLRREHGGMITHQIMVNVAEYQARRKADGYRWDGEAWIGGDIDRLVVKSEGTGTFGKSIAAAEVQALYSHAIDPYWNLQAGVRYDIAPDPSRTYAAIGLEGLAPYWFEVEAALFVSDKGDVLGRAEAWHDARLTQALVLQPRLEANFAAQDVRPTGIGSGLTELELGLRLRYQESRALAPYLGVSWQRQFGDTARFTRARGGDTGGLAWVAGIRTWF